MSKKSKLKNILIGLFIISIIIFGGGYILTKFAFSCFDDTRKTGISQVSDNLEFARNNGLLISEIELSKDTLKLNDTLSFKIAESWIEIGWEYQCINHELQIVKNPDIKKLVIKLENASWSDYIDNYSIELENGFGGTQNGLLIFYTDSLKANKLKVYQLKERFKFKGNKILSDSIELKK
ncbi:MAG TPA: hypothetical protein VIN10_07655 [Bacteroidales bacterium]